MSRPMSEIAALTQRLQHLHQRTVETPMFNPVFQLASRTLPLSVAAVIALGFNFAALALTPATQSIDTLACVNSLAFVVALVIVGAWAFRCAEAHPRLRDLVVVVVAATAMGFALRPLNGLGAPAVSAVLALAGGGAL